MRPKASPKPLDGDSSEMLDLFVIECVRGLAIEGAHSSEASCGCQMNDNESGGVSVWGDGGNKSRLVSIEVCGVVIPHVP